MVKSTSRFSRGATLLELSVALVIAGILAAITLPNLAIFLQKQQLSTATNQLFQNVRSTRSLAAKNITRYAIEFSLNNTADGSPRNAFAVYPVRNNITNDRTTAVWTTLPQGIELHRVRECPRINENPIIQFDYRANYTTQETGGNAECTIYVLLNTGVGVPDLTESKYSSPYDGVKDPKDGAMVKVIAFAGLLGSARIVE